MMTANDPLFPDLTDKVIMVTGGTGSFGQAFCRIVLNRWKPRKLIVFSRDEDKQWKMSIDNGFRDHHALRFFIGDVRDEPRLEMAMRGVDYVIHAAALKHVPAAEYNPFECIRTNVHGAENIVQAAIRTGVKKVVALSTDKAVSPINLYGASKLAADKIFVAANNLVSSGEPAFAVVRYGNVLGSRGSVVSLFRRMVGERASHLPITDPRMTRFWITLRQGVEFVLRCLANMKGGEIFIPKIPSMKVVDLIEALAPGYPTKTIGIRPGEKLHEVLITEDDALNTLAFESCYLIRPISVLKLKSAQLAFDRVVGRAVPEHFQYRSDLNEWTLKREELKALLLETEEREAA
jgi:UDP-N-acetylglucosamine 4,6-dehydratase